MSPPQWEGGPGSYSLVQSSSKQCRKWSPTMMRACREMSAMYICNRRAGLGQSGRGLPRPNKGPSPGLTWAPGGAVGLLHLPIGGVRAQGRDHQRPLQPHTEHGPPPCLPPDHCLLQLLRLHTAHCAGGPDNGPLLQLVDLS